MCLFMQTMLEEVCRQKSQAQVTAKQTYSTSISDACNGVVLAVFKFETVTDGERLTDSLHYNLLQVQVTCCAPARS